MNNKMGRVYAGPPVPNYPKQFEAEIKKEDNVVQRVVYAGPQFFNQPNSQGLTNGKTSEPDIKYYCDCGFSTDQEYKYCPMCGKELQSKTSTSQVPFLCTCGYSSETYSKFCPECGALLKKEPS